MGVISQLVAGALREYRGGKTRPFPRFRRRWDIKIDDYGEARCRVLHGDLDGSGEAPGVQLEIEHTFIQPGHAGLAMSAREAELLAKALERAASQIKPSERLRARRRKWSESVVVNTTPTGEMKTEKLPAVQDG